MISPHYEEKHILPVVAALKKEELPDLLSDGSKKSKSGKNRLNANKIITFQDRQQKPRDQTWMSRTIIIVRLKVVCLKVLL